MAMSGAVITISISADFAVNSRGCDVVLSLILKILAVAAGFISAGCWLYSVKTISRDEEIERRRRKAGPDEVVSLASVVVGDGDKAYELPATLRHQGTWSRNGAIFAAAAILLQAVDIGLAMLVAPT
jgi:hypothetical protein